MPHPTLTLSLSWDPTRPDTLRILIEPDHGQKACNKDLYLYFSRESTGGRDTVISDDTRIGGYREARYPDPFEGQYCNDPVKQANARSWITKVSENRIPDDMGPRNGTARLYHFQCHWESWLLTGDLNNSTKMIHH